MGSIEDFFGSGDSSEVVKSLSSSSPKAILSYLITSSKRVLSIYALMRDSLPKGYGKVRFSRFVDMKGKQVENLCKIALKLYPEALSHDLPEEVPNISFSTTGDYLSTLRAVIRIEGDQLDALKNLVGNVSDPDVRAIIGDTIESIKNIVSLLSMEIQRVEKADSRAKFAEFVKELVGDRDGRI
ncbi:hypothetical protein [Thermococcus sp.]|uniref:hypothetical protein n=1 Tax=Thermococcus sp. TaxID=35749 RepID=UPI00261EFF49|nr:hypothetical protein [Thermococcus sp.]